jgi:hypothetical protein
MKTANCLIEKQKSQLNFILNWATQTTDQEPLEKHHCQRSLKSPDLSAFDSFDLSTSISSLTDDNNIINIYNNKTDLIDHFLLLSSSFAGSSIYDSLNDLVNTKVNRAK